MLPSTFSCPESNRADLINTILGDTDLHSGQIQGRYSAPKGVLQIIALQTMGVPPQNIVHLIAQRWSIGLVVQASLWCGIDPETIAEGCGHDAVAAWREMKSRGIKDLLQAMGKTLSSYVSIRMKGTPGPITFKELLNAYGQSSLQQEMCNYSLPKIFEILCQEMTSTAVLDYLHPHQRQEVLAPYIVPRLTDHLQGIMLPA